ncbi:TonB-dependent receptor [Stakelama saccharophila]|uniref:TonB-dependent receptor n=1 Tax=Stakelama saccharophila TaxID=3075605 RepID=A0ABZ0B8M2_9SPHN|nr:TonB-dependent receptor [Stakelama sp. W311]WNO53766.1 TonB-dependent receptor [Stakelama sp. W311]
MRSRILVTSSVMAVAFATATPSYAAAAETADGEAAPKAAAQRAASSDAAGKTVEEIVVIGRGETRQVQGLTQEDIAVSPPGTSPLALLDKLPSVNFQSATPFGSNEWSTRISVRGFTQNQLGFVLDGVPLGDMSYGNFNGLHISRAISSNNIARTELSQGAGALSTPSSSNLGGTIEFFSRDPADEIGGDVSATYGSNDAWRLFGRVDTGDLGGGVKAYFSGDYAQTPKWKGKGAQHALHVNGKVKAPLGTDGSISAFVNYSYLADDDYVDMWPGLLERKGYNWNYLRYDWDTATAIADNYQERGIYEADYPGYGTLTGDDAYYDGYGLRRDILMGANLEYDLTDKLSVELTPYYHRNRGIGTWWTFYTPTPGGANLSVRGTEYWIDREGLTGSLSYDLFSGNTLEVGGWYEHNDYKQARDYFGLRDTDHSSIHPREWPDHPFAYDYYYDFNINTYQYYVQDSWQVTDALKVTGGWKGIDVDIVSRYDPERTNVDTWGTNGELEAEDMFLPQVGLNYRPIDALEVFASYSENMRAFTTGPFITSPDQFAALKASDLKPETSWTAEGGVRVHLPRFDGSLAAYHVKFDDRLFSVSPCTAIQSCPSILDNVGSVTTNGIEATGTYRPVRHLSLYASYSYSHAEYDDDVLNGGGEVVVASAGKAVVDQPRHQANAEIAYDDGALFARAKANYQSKRYATYENDLSFDGRTLVDLTLGYRLKGDGMLGGTEIQLNVTNLTDEEYVATIGETGGYLTSYSEGDYQYFLVGPPRQVFVTLKKSF